MPDDITLAGRDPQLQSRLFRLPDELILRVLFFVTGPARGLTVNVNNHPVQRDPPDRRIDPQPIIPSNQPSVVEDSIQRYRNFSSQLSFCKTCKSGYSIGIDELYRVPIFRFNYIETADAFLDAIGDANRRAMRHVQLTIAPHWDYVSRQYPVVDAWTWRDGQEVLEPLVSRLPALRTCYLQMRQCIINKTHIGFNGLDHLKRSIHEEKAAFESILAWLRTELSPRGGAVHVMNTGPNPDWSYDLDGFPVGDDPHVIGGASPAEW